MDFQHPHGYNRLPLPPPPPSMADPHYPPPPPPPQSQRPPVPPPNSWYSPQFQYHPPSQHSPSPPPAHPSQQWGPLPPPYPAPPHAPYPSHPLPHSHYPPPLPTRPNLPPQVPQSYPHANQDWGNANWGHHQTVEYSVPHSNEEDWAAKARAWAAAKAASENQQPQFTQAGRLEEQSHYYDRYPHSADPHFQDSQPRVLPPSYQQFTAPAARSQNIPGGHSNESAAIGLGKSSYVHDGHLAYTARDESLAGDSTSALPQQGNLSVSPLVHWPEVSSSYSSVAGEEVGDQNDKLYNSQSLTVTSALQHQVKPPLPVGPGSTMNEEPHHSFGGQLTEAAINPMDKPLVFAPQVNRDHGLHMESNYSYSDSVGPASGVDPVSGMTSAYAWPPATAGVEPTMVVPSPVPGLSAPVFGRLPGPNFQSTVPPVGPTFGITPGAAGPTAFPTDAYAISTDRPKKASVPNWLREEIIKKKAVITSSAPDLQKDDALEDEDVNKPYRRGDQGDIKSVDSSRSTEGEDDDEDDADAARTAAINQEIKRVLTEVLLKVTDELFDEIATKVLNEDVLSIEAEPDATLSSHKLSTSAHAVLTPKASAKVLLPFKTIEADSDDGSKKSSSGSPGNVLGLANYESDDDNEIQSTVKQNPNEDSCTDQSIAIKQVDAKNLIGNGSSLKKIEKVGGFSDNVEHARKGSPNFSSINHGKLASQSSDGRASIELVHGDSQPSSKAKSGVLEENLAEEVPVEIEGKNGSVDKKKRKTENSHIQESQNKSGKSNSRDNTAADSSKGKHKDKDNVKDRTFEKEDYNHKKHDRHVKNEKFNDPDQKDKVKDKIVKSGEKENESDSRRRASIDTKEGKGKTDREGRSSTKGDSGRRREKVKDEKREKSRRKDASDSGKHKRQRSSSVGSRGRESKDNLVSYPTDSSDESSDDYKRKLYSRRHRSPSPVRSRKRQVSRSPHSKHSQRRHSPYSSLETTRCTSCNYITPLHESAHEGCSSPEMERSSRASESDLQALVQGLWLIWAFGFLLIGVSLYATQLLPSSSLKYHHTKNLLGDLGEIGPKITIFTAPRPFDGVVGETQNLAVRSWLGLSPHINVVLFTQHPSAFSFAKPFGSRVTVQPNIDFSFIGTPFFHSMVANSQASSSDVSVLIHPQTVLLSDFILTVRHAYKLDHDWLLFASSRKISYFPFHLDADGKQWLTDDDDGTLVDIDKMQGLLSKEQQWYPCQGQILIAWNNAADIPLHNGILPPFLYGKGFHNLWVINEAFRSDFRFVFDASWAISNLYLHHPDLKYKKSSEGLMMDTAPEERIWEFMGNSLLATQYGSLYFHETTFSNLFRLFKCGGHYLFANTAENIVYRLGYKKPFSLKKSWLMHKSTEEEKILNCIASLESVDSIKDCSLMDQLNLSTPISLPLPFESLLSMCAGQNKTVVLAVVGYSYKDMLMSWVCRMRHLQIFNFLVCALDNEVYDFSILQGLPVFKYSSIETNISFDDCHFGTECFKRVTKIKSRMVLQILKMGYNVLMSDVDVYWFKNPLPLLSSFGPAVLVAQSDEYNVTGAINLPRRLNSGFYYAHSDRATVAALEKVVMHAATSNLSEQPSFYDVLCGEGGSNRIGDNRCSEPETNLTVHFLDRDLFPNGAYQGLWEERNVKEACVRRGCFVLHNNWISGRQKKLERQVLSGLWDYDISTRMCLKSWHDTKSVSYF
ncbi:PREDICTED: uncharacterized protein LOC109162332 [Ipomoea nil]|uniref:uncharacterized protein LOC109162332 n=1 Tax=Ipomoea nil TaxID=35883 RepID=UPI000901EA07|nr:PREDICTED: uncharacterized protein LOC109162332 [Ipomoea nil]